MQKQEKWMTVALVLVFLLSLGSLCFAAAEEATSSSDTAQTSSAPLETSSDTSSASSQDSSESEGASSDQEETEDPQSSSEAQGGTVSVTVEPSSSAPSVTVTPSSQPVISEDEHDPGLAGSATAPGVVISSDPVSSQSAYEVPSDDGQEDFSVPEKKNMPDIAGSLRIWIILPVLLAVASIAAIVWVNRKRFLDPNAPKKK